MSDLLQDKLILFDAKMLEPLTFVSLWGKSRRFNYFSGHVVFVSEKKPLRLSRKISLFQKTLKTEIFSRNNETVSIIQLTRNRFELERYFPNN